MVNQQLAFTRKAPEFIRSMRPVDMEVRCVGGGAVYGLSGSCFRLLHPIEDLEVSFGVATLGKRLMIQF